jgi:peptidyl-prolyl cis-trans isomerase SurA
MTKTPYFTAALLWALAGPAWTQAPRLDAGSSQTADRIVALVNSEPVTQQEVQRRLASLELPPAGQRPPREVLLRQVLERLIVEKVQLQWAEQAGLSVDAAQLDQAEANVARQNRLTLPQLHERLREMGLTPAAFRQNLRQELLLQRVREREEARVRVTEQDIDDYLREQQSTSDPAQTVLHLAQVLVAVPDNASIGALATLESRARQLADRARRGDDFAALAREASAAPEAQAGGSLGRRNADRYPSLFVEATASARTGDVVGPVRSGAGWHILKVLEKRSANAPDTEVTETRARHILLRGAEGQDPAPLAQRLATARERIASGQATFDAVAREISQDGSAAAGGDLGWARPGQFVPEFEQVMNALAAGEVSRPVASRFGVHLIQVTERRQAPLSVREQREWVRNVVRERKAEQAYADWVRDLRAQAYVELREPPQ